MKRQIRRNVFETNSSSMHSLVILKKNEYYTEEEARECFYVGKDGFCKINYSFDDEKMHFGRYPFRILTTFKDKICYTLASMCKFKNDEVYKEVCDTIRSYIPEFKDFKCTLESNVHTKRWYTEDTIKSMYGENNYIDTDEYWITWKYYLGSVEEDILTRFLEKKNITIKEFITNKKYIVVIDGDEYYIFDKCKASGIIDLKMIEDEYCPNDYLNGGEKGNETENQE